MPNDVAISAVHWWDLDEIAAHDTRIFGATAWTLNYYWAVMAQSGTVMFQAGTTSAGERSSASAGERSSDSAGEQSADSVGELAGWVVMSAGGSEADVMTIATTEAGRGRGIGRCLLGAGIDWARGRGAHVIHLEVDEHNESALGLYQSAGFSEWGRREDYYPGADAILMRRRLPPE